MSWPQSNDPYYLYNTSENNARRAYYGVNATPSLAVDGSLTNLWPPQPAWGNLILQEATLTAPISIDIGGVYDTTARQGTAEIRIFDENGSAGTYLLHLVLIENNLYFMGANGHPNHNNVMRDMIPSPAGTQITLSPGDSTFESIDFSVPDPIVQGNAVLVAFVQNPVNKEVLNAGRVAVVDLAAGCGNAVGDVGGDGQITVQDLVQLVNIIIGVDQNPDACALQAGDLNGDTQVNVQDLVLLVDLILQ